MNPSLPRLERIRWLLLLRARERLADLQGGAHAVKGQPTPDPCGSPLAEALGEVLLGGAEPYSATNSPAHGPTRSAASEAILPPLSVSQQLESLLNRIPRVLFAALGERHSTRRERAASAAVGLCERLLLLRTICHPVQSPGSRRGAQGGLPAGPEVTAHQRASHLKEQHGVAHGEGQAMAKCSMSMP